MRLAGPLSCAFALIAMPVEADESEKPEQRFRARSTGGSRENLRDDMPLPQKSTFRTRSGDRPLVSKAPHAELSEAQRFGAGRPDRL
jgi:hypothetical protein